MEVTLNVKVGTTINNHKYLGQAEKTEVSYKLPNQVNPMTVNTTKTPVLRLGYDVTYETNIPHDCSNTLIAPSKETYLAFDTVTKSLENLACDNYLFKGWEVTDDTGEDIQFITDDTFAMPEHDVVIRAIWSNVSIAKTQEGTVLEKPCANPMKFELTGEYACLDNEPSEFVNDEKGIKFDIVNSLDNGQGLYIRAGTENDEYPIMYYRGAVTNNNVIFAHLCWKTVRTTETGGIKLIYNGLPTEDNQCTNTTGLETQINSKAYFWNNIYYNSAKYVGYMYDNNSDIAQHGDMESNAKVEIDKWYESNIDDKGYTKYLEDVVWCNDRTIGETSGNIIYYTSYTRWITNRTISKPFLKDEEVCSNKEDRYTVSDTTKGNGALTYPVGLLTSDEMVAAGGSRGNNNSNYYLFTGNHFWLLSPRTYGTNGGLSYVHVVFNSGDLKEEVLAGLRPSVSLRSSTMFSSGNGEPETPYIVDTSS